jgi:hypothetical protein
MQTLEPAIIMWGVFVEQPAHKQLDHINESRPIRDDQLSFRDVVNLRSRQ